MLLRANDNELDVVVHGSGDGVPVLLLSDADAPAIRWPQPLIELLVEAGFQVVTFDHRDCGASSRPETDYTLVDMAADAMIIRNELVGQGAISGRPIHLVGMGMGGTIAMLMALAEPTMIASMVLVGATAGRTDESLPDPNPDLVNAMVDRHFRPAPQSREDKVAWLVEQAQLFAGTRYGFDEWEAVSAATDEVERFWNPESGHGNAVVSTESIRDVLGEIAAPTLVIHGDVDPVFPVGHGEVLANELAASELVIVHGLGHEFPAALVVELGDRVVQHIQTAS